MRAGPTEIIKVMVNFKALLEDTIQDNEIEELVPSRDYTPEEIIYKRGYNQALKDMHADFVNEFEKFIEELNRASLN